MSLTFGAAASDRVNCGSSTSHDGLTVGTKAYICRPTSLGVTYSPRFMQKGLTANGDYRAMFFTGTTSLSGEVQRAGVDVKAQAVCTNFAAYALSTWMLMAFTWDINGIASDQKLYIGNATTPPAEPSAYASQTVGDGALGDDSAADWIVGNNQNVNVAFLGDLAVQGVWSRQLTGAELGTWFNNPSDVGANNIMLHSIGSNGTDTQHDYSGNGNHGAVTGATVSTNKPPVGLWTPNISPILTNHERDRTPLILR